MKKKLKLPRLPRKWKIVRNLLCAAVLLTAFLLAANWPVFTHYGAYRRLEQQYLLEPSKLVLQIGGEDRAILTQGESWITAGKVSRVDSGGSFLFHYYPIINYVLPLDGLVVVGLPGPDPEQSLVFAVTGLPEGAENGEMVLPGLTDNMGTLTAQGERDGEWMFFTFSHDHPVNERCVLNDLWLDHVLFWEGLPELTYSLKLTDETGTAVLETTAALPKAQNLR